MSHPIQLVHYACGHATPVRGTGGTSSRPCKDCVSAPGKPARIGSLETLPLWRILGYNLHTHKGESQ